jgi:hypothetical protein
VGKVKWWLLRPCNLLLWEYGSTSGFNEQRNDGCFVRATYCGEGGALWFDCSLVIITAAQRPGWISPAVVHSILLHGRWSRMKDVPHVGETKLNCFWHCYQSFRICLYVRIIFQHNEIVRWCYEGFNFGSRRKKKVSTLGFMCPLASRLSRYNIPSNINETTMAANASQWFIDQHQYSHHNWRQSCEKVYK